MGFVCNHLEAFKLQMVVQAPMSATTSSIYYLGPQDQRPSIWGLGEYVAATIEGSCPSTTGNSYEMKMIPLSLGNIFLLKEKAGMRESIPRQVDEKCGGSPRRDKPGVLEEEERTNFFCFFSTFLSLSHIQVFLFLFFFFFKAWTNDYTTNNSV